MDEEVDQARGVGLDRQRPGRHGNCHPDPEGPVQGAVAPDRFDKDWEECVKMLDVPIREIPGPESVILACTIQADTRFRLISAVVYYYDLANASAYPRPPFDYSLTLGTVTGMKPIIDDLPAVLVCEENTSSHARSSPVHVLPKRAVCYVPALGDRGLFQLGGRQPDEGSDRQGLHRRGT